MGDLGLSELYRFSELVPCFEVSSGHWEPLRATKGEDSGREECPKRPFLSLSEVVLLVTVGGL